MRTAYKVVNLAKITNLNELQELLNANSDMGYELEVLEMEGARGGPPFALFSKEAGDSVLPQPIIS